LDYRRRRHDRHPVLAGVIAQVEHVLEDPGMASLFERLGTFARVILIDRRGSGLPDPLDASLTLEEEVDDVIAVLDAAGSDCAVLLGYLTGGPLAIKVATERPARVRARSSSTTPPLRSRPARRAPTGRRRARACRGLRADDRALGHGRAARRSWPASSRSA
jgi:pimeloyl-ACP methyl ester carboxylesterase